MDSGCCGTEFEKNNVSKTGCFLFLFPIYAFCLVPSALDSIIFKLTKVHMLPSVILKITEITKGAITTAKLIPTSRNKFSSTLIKIHPRMGSFFFKYFNHLFIGCIWCICLIIPIGFFYESF